MKNKKIRFMTQGALIAAIYVVLTVLGASFSFGEVQVRISEALTVLPYFTPAAVPGLFVGCLLGNLIGGAALPDIIFGSLATLVGAICTYLLRGRSKYLAPLPPILANAFVVPFILRFAYGVSLPIPLMMLSVGAGQFIACGILGMLLLNGLSKVSHKIFTENI